MRGLITAFRTLTVLPVPGREADRLSASLSWFPVVGAVLGGLLYTVASFPGWLGRPGWPEATAAAVLVLSCLLTRGLHLDGVADWADAAWGGRDREQRLRILKDSAIGAFGAIALVLVLLVKWVLLVRLLEVGGARWIPAAMVISRTLQVDAAVAHPYARAEGGTAAAFVSGATWRHGMGALMLACPLLILCCEFDWQCVAALVPAWVLGRVYGVHARARFGGITGDLLGAGSELTEIAVLTIGVLL